MSKTVSYSDAVKLLGGKENKVVQALDALTGGLLLAATAAGNGFALALFDAKSELSRLSMALVNRMSAAWHGVNRFTRTERIAAAHAIIVMAAYFGALSKADLPFSYHELELTKFDKVDLATGVTLTSQRLQVLAEALIDSAIPIPTPQQPYDVTLAHLASYYHRLSTDLLNFITGISVWDSISETDRNRLGKRLVKDLPQRAVAMYEEYFRTLASEFPELEFWVSITEHSATRIELRRLQASLSGLENVLLGIAANQHVHDNIAALARGYRAALAKPILPSGEAPPGLSIPQLSTAYLNPHFRVAQLRPGDMPAQDTWWDHYPTRSDLQDFLLGHLTAPQATRVPLLVLGQPGAGKSVLTRVLAARMPPGDFLAVRVPLREVPIDADLQAQIEYAVREATGDDIRWSDLVRMGGPALPIVMLDGFDELLQVTGVSQSDYLERVVAFQSREADQGRPLAVIVTTRTAVADRARFVDGTVAIRLEPFGVGQIGQWLDIWNHTNRSYFHDHRLKPLPSRVALAHPHLACQPLLLMMLAIHDADSNSLQRDVAEMGLADLYERLLRRFAEREVRKDNPSLSDSQVQREVERELLHLGIAAFAMFNRSRQWATAAELDGDLGTLLKLNEVGFARSGPPTMKAALTAGELLIGRFFFVHEAQAVRDDVRLRTYEFLHATFGEFLVSRLIVREVTDLAEATEWSASRSRAVVPDDSFIHSLLSFAPLTMRATIPAFLVELLAGFDAERREVTRKALLALFRRCFDPRSESKYGSYVPSRLPVPVRYAVYSANLTLLLTRLGQTTGTTELFPDSADSVEEWRRLALLWRSQLPREGWSALLHTIEVVRERRADGSVDICVQPSRKGGSVGPLDLAWIHRYSTTASALEVGVLRKTQPDRLRETYFLCDPSLEASNQALEPLMALGGDVVDTLVAVPGHEIVSLAKAWVELCLVNTANSSSERLAEAYEPCLSIMYSHRGGYEDLHGFIETLLQRMAADVPRLPRSWLASVVMRAWRNPTWSNLVESCFAHTELLTYYEGEFGRIMERSIQQRRHRLR